jgi:cbb3-type cytochrome oxidase subunit 3
MKQEAFRYFTDQHITIIGLFIFFSFFIGLLVTVYRRSQSPYYEYMSKLPISDKNGDLNHERQ